MHFGWIFLFGFFFGGIVECLAAFLFEFLKKKPIRLTHRFTLGKRISLFLLPIWGIVAVLFTHGGMSYLWLFIVSALIGTLLEGVLGKFFRLFFGIKLWSYKKGAIGTFTSLYAIPYWGGAGLLFGLLGKTLGF